MFARLRKRFVLITVAAVASGLLCIGAAINIVNYVVTTNDLDGLLASISENEDEWEIDDHEGGLGRGLRGLTDRGGRFQSAEALYATRWFSLSVSSNGTVVDADLSHIASVTANDLADYGQLVADSSGSGFRGDFRYLIVKGSALGDATGISIGYFVDASEELYQMRTLLWTTIIVGVVALALVFLIIIGVSKRVIEPLVEADRRQKRFVTDASHELKTPLAIIHTSLAMLKLEPADQADRQKWIDKTERSADRIASLVDDMVTLARVDEEVGQQEATFDAAVAVRQTGSEFEDHALASGHDLTIDTPQTLPYKGDEDGVRRLVSVLLDNAIRYATPDGAIMLSLQSAGRNSLRITCENPVESFDASALEHLFDRFYRPDESRTKATGGFGIGLSIARSICEASGGSITATMPNETTIRFTALMK